MGGAGDRVAATRVTEQKAMRFKTVRGWMWEDVFVQVR
jgi:hypothetical protein